MTIRVGVAGLGYWGPNLARNFAGLPGCELTWCCDASDAARDVELRDESVELGSGFEEAPSGIALKRRDARRTVRQQDIHRHPRGEREDGRETHSERQFDDTREGEPMLLIIRGGAILQLKILRVDGTVGERNLVIVGIVESFRQGIGSSELIAI